MLDRMIGPAGQATISSVNARLSRIEMYLAQIAAQVTAAPVTEPEASPQFVVLSSLNPNAHWLTPGSVRITSLMIGGDTSGRGVLQIGSDASLSIPVWVGASLSVILLLDETQRRDLTTGIDVQWVKPGGTNWDVIIGYYLRQPSGRRSK